MYSRFIFKQSRTNSTTQARRRGNWTFTCQWMQRLKDALARIFTGGATVANRQQLRQRQPHHQRQRSSLAKQAADHYAKAQGACSKRPTGRPTQGDAGVAASAQIKCLRLQGRGKCRGEAYFALVPNYLSSTVFRVSVSSQEPRFLSEGGVLSQSTTSSAISSTVFSSHCLLDIQAALAHLACHLLHRNINRLAMIQPLDVDAERLANYHCNFFPPVDSASASAIGTIG
jgi:hypothetical protein